MESIPNTHLTTALPHPRGCVIGEPRSPFAQKWVTMSKQDYIELRHRASYWEIQHGRAKAKIAQLEQELVVKDGNIKDSSISDKIESIVFAGRAPHVQEAQVPVNRVVYRPA